MLQTVLKAARKTVKKAKKLHVKPERSDRKQNGAVAPSHPGADVDKVEAVATVVSFPKAGRTWLRVMLDDLEIPCDYSHDRSSHKEAFAVEDLGPPGAGLPGERFIFVHRDPRDTVVSGFHQATKRLKSYQGDLSAFIRDPRHGIEKIALFNLGWLSGGPKDARVHRLSYEEMTADTEGCLQAIAAFVDVPVTSERLRRTVDDNRFDKMQKRERAGDFDERYGPALRSNPSSDPEGLKVRRGKVGGFEDELSADDVAYCDEVLARLDYWRRIDGG